MALGPRGHDQIVRAQLARCRGREIRRMGDGFLAAFDGPARPIRCARAISAAVLPLGIEIRAGLHTGEIELAGDDVAGSGLAMEDRGRHVLKGVPDEWRLYAVGRN
jgi:class 3 adenylate cyclase